MSARLVARLAVLVAVAATLQIAESLVPKPLPWLRLGLANGVALLALARIGLGGALVVTLVRTSMGALLLGTFGGPPHLLALSGSLAALAAMAAGLRLLSPPLTLLGVSVLGAAAHVVGQLAALGALFELGRSVMLLAPVLLATAVPLGLVTGAVILAVHRRLPPW